MLLDSYAYNNRWRHVHPAEKGLLAIICLLATLASRSVAVPIIILVLMSGLILFGARIPLRVYLRLLTVPLAFLLIGTSTLAVSFSGGEIPLGELPLVHLPLALSYAGIDQAIMAMARALGAVSCLYLLALTTPMTEIIGLLRRLRVPELFLELMLLAYRHIFIFLENVRQIRLAQSSRLGYSSVVNAWRSLAVLGGNLLLRTFRRSQQLHQSLLARGYDDELRYLEEQYAWSPRNLLCGGTIGLLALTLAFCLPG